jgi:thiamine biosynthesis lipoprotein
MGSHLRLSVAGGSAGDAERAWRAAREEMAQADRELSRFRVDSALSRANQLAASGAWFAAPRRLGRMLAACHRAMRLTDGRFDPRVIHALEALGEVAGFSLPHDAAATERRWLERDWATGRFRIASAADSGGIGKGLGLRWAMVAARAAAPSPAGLLLDAGGDIAAWGRAPDGIAWSVGIEDPTRPEELLATVDLADRAIATTSIAHRAWMHEGRRVHHLVNPRSGLPAETGLTAVTVAMADPAWAEVWTKALLLAGSGAIGQEARARGLAAWWVETDNRLHMTPAARQLTTWVRDEATAA